MQIGAMNSMGFKGNDIYMLPVTNEKQGSYVDSKDTDVLEPDEILDGEDCFSKSVNEDDSEFAPSYDEDDAEFRKMTGEKLRKYIETKQDAESNVRILTIISSVALLLGIAAKGNKIAKPVMRTLVTAGEAVSKGAVRLAGKVFKKINVDSITDKIASKAEQVRVGAPDNKMLNGVKTLVDKVFPSKVVQAIDGEKVATHGENVVAVLKKIGIQNKTDIARNAVVGAIALGAADKFADRFEGTLDRAEINRAKKDLIGNGLGVAAELVNAVM